MAMEKIIIGADHAGYQLKEALKPFLKELGFAVTDVGTDGDRPTDYPDYAATLSDAVQATRMGAFHFFENTINEMKRMSLRKKTGIGEGRHSIVFHKGKAIEMICPKRGRCPIRNSIA